MARVIILDANVVIAYLDSTDPHHARTVELLNDRQRDGFASSALTVAEALVHPTRTGQHDAALAALNTIGLLIVPVAESDVMGLARIRSQYRVRMPDAVALHLAVATTSQLATFDDALAGAARLAGVVVVD